MINFVIITPSYNQANYLIDCLTSVENQSVPRTHIIIDGQSQDGSQEILIDYSRRPRDYSFQYLIEEDEGQSSAINKGWRMVRGDVYSWLNSDDILCPEALKKVEEAFISHPEVDFVYGNCNYIDELGIHLGTYPVEPFDYDKFVSNAESTIPQPACFIRAEALSRSGFLREDLHYVMDLELWLRLGADGKGLYIPYTLACLRLHEEAKSIKHFGEFSSELITMYTRFFKAYQDRPSIKSKEQEAMYHVFTKAADIYFWSGQFQESWASGLRAFWRFPFRKNKLLWRVLIMSFLALVKILPSRYTLKNHYQTY